MTPDDLIRFLDSRSDDFLRNSIRKLIGRLRHVAEPEDVLQELVSRLLPKIHRFRPERGDSDTFLSLAAFRCLASILRDQRAAKRFVKAIKSLHDWVLGLDGRRQPLIDALDDRQVGRHRGRVRRSPIEETEMRMDLTDAIEALPPDLREVAELLGRLSVTEIAAELGLGRTTVHARIRRIRQRFEKKNLREYL